MSDFDRTSDGQSKYVYHKLSPFLFICINLGQSLPMSWWFEPNGINIVPRSPRIIGLWGRIIKKFRKDSLIWLILVRNGLLKPYFGGNLGLKLKILGQA